jgi:carbon storage regulator CsrA
MLVVRRRRLESLQIGPDVVVTVVRIGADAVELGIQAPPEFKIRRNALRAWPLLAVPQIGCATLVQSKPAKELNHRG